MSIHITESGVTSLPAIPAGALDGAFIRVSIAGISAAATYHLKLNGNTIFTGGVPAAGDTFYNEVVFTWNSTNKDITPSNYIGGTASNLAAFNPADFTFSTDAGNTITSFSLIAE